MASFASLSDLNTFLVSRSYISGFKFSAEDSKVLSTLSSYPDAKTYPHAYRWAKHISALTGYSILLASTSSIANAPVASGNVAKPVANDDFDDMFGDDEPVKKADDIDNMFGDDDEDGETEEEKAATRARKERMETARKLKEEADAKKGKKKADKPPEKSLIVLDVKPWEADTDLVALWHQIRQYQQDGLVWGETYKLEPVAYGINKLVMTVAIEDKKVLLDDVTENIESIEEFVQSVTVASMNKI